MGTWKLPKSRNDALRLQDLCANPICAREAHDLVIDGFIGDGNLSEAIVRARSSDPSADVRPLVVNTVAHLYFTGSPATKVASAGASELLREIVEGWSSADDDVFFAIARVKVERDAETSFSEALDLTEADLQNWIIVRDPNGYDFVARNVDGDTYRLSALYDYVVKVHPANLEMYDRAFADAARPRP